MAWQKCPVCSGSGWGNSSYSLKCSVCNGMKIINELTGKPPLSNIVTISNITNEVIKGITGDTPEIKIKIPESKIKFI